MMDLKKMRIEKKLTQEQVSKMLGISLRSYKSYENDPKKMNTMKYNYMIEKLLEINRIDENHGILELEDITKKCREVFDKYEVHFCYIFGSYAKGKATETSDVDLVISTSTKGLKFYGLVEDVRTVLNKRVDILDVNQLKDNLELIEEVLKDGIKIYG